MPLLAKKVAIITGASSGIGRASACLFAAEGAAVVLAARRADLLDTTAQEIIRCGGSAVTLAGDVQHESYHQQLVELALQEFGRLDIGFHNAGILGTPGPADELSLAGWKQLLDTNLTSAWLAAKHQLPAMQRNGDAGGSLIMTSSFVGHTRGLPGLAAYGASKAGIIGLVRCLAAEYGPARIRVNALLPGGTDTDMARSFADTPESRESVARMHALQRMASAEEIAHTALYLASDASSFTTGTALLADGGVSIY